MKGKAVKSAIVCQFQNKATFVTSVSQDVTVGVAKCVGPGQRKMAVREERAYQEQSWQAETPYASPELLECLKRGTHFNSCINYL